MSIQPQFTWLDRRPIGILHLSDPTRITPDNPNGWLEPPETWPTVYIPRSIAVLKEIGAQGVIVWDCEGTARDPYLGSPDLADASDGILDKFFAAYRLAGYKVGCLIRPDEYNPDTGKLAPSPDPVWTLTRKGTYARKRWGCRMFYIDSNMYDCRTSGELLSPTIFAQLRKLMTGTLFVPEHPNTPGSTLDDVKTFWTATGYWRDTAPYIELRNGHTETPHQITDMVPKAMSLINVTSSAKLMNDNMAALVLAVQRGDVMLVDAHCDHECIDPLVEIMKAAA